MTGDRVDDRSDRIAIIDELYSAATEPECWPEAVAALSRHLGADGAAMVRNVGQQEPISHVGGGADLDMVELHRYVQGDKSWVRAAQKLALGDVAVLDVPGDHRPSSCAIPEAPTVRHVVYLSLPSLTGPTGVGGLAVHFSNVGSTILEEAADLLRELGPHLDRAVWLSQRVDHGRIVQQRLNHMIHAAPHPVVLVTATGRIAAVNAAAATLVDRRDGLAVDRDGHLQATSPKSRRALETLFLAAAAGETIPEAVAVDRTSRSQIRLLLSLLPRDRALPVADPESEPILLLSVIDPEHPQCTKAEMLSAVYGLTTAEARVAVLLATGMGRDRAATRLSISLETLKKQTAACFRKLGVSSQAGVAHVVTAMPGARPRPHAV